jgi:hypothetical protein
MIVVILRSTQMSLIVGIRSMFRNSFNFTTLVQISADTIRMVYEMRLCADIPSGDLPDGIRMASGEHCSLNSPLNSVPLSQHLFYIRLE